MPIREEYIQQLKILSETGIRNPTLESVRTLFCFLTEKQIEHILEPDNGKQKSVAMPATQTPEKRFHLAVLSPDRKFLSYHGFISAGGLSGKLDKYAQNAADFTRKNWADALVESKAKGFYAIDLYNPSKMMKRSYYPTYILSVFFTTSADRLSIIHSKKPKSQALDDAIIDITDNRAVGLEIGFGHSRNLRTNCALDGAGLKRTSCSYCHRNFVHEQVHTDTASWQTPLPKKVADYLIQHSHKFEVDPKLARENEALIFAKTH